MCMSRCVSLESIDNDLNRNSWASKYNCFPTPRNMSLHADLHYSRGWSEAAAESPRTPSSEAPVSLSSSPEACSAPGSFSRQCRPSRPSPTSQTLRPGSGSCTSIATFESSTCWMTYTPFTAVVKWLNQSLRAEMYNMQFH